MDPESIWRSFPRTVEEFEEQFPDEESCRRFLVMLRWGGRPLCRRCGSRKAWTLKSGRFECCECNCQFSVTAGTPLHGTRKPLRLWLRAVWEMMARKPGISAKDLQRTLGFGSYETAWTWLHKLRACMVTSGRSQLGGAVQFDETYFGGADNRPGRPKGNKALVLVAVEHKGRARLEHAPDLTIQSVRSFAERNLADADIHVTTDGYRSYGGKSLGERPHHRHEQKAKRNIKIDPLSFAHLTISLAKRLWIGTYHGTPSRNHLQAYLDEFVFRFNRRNTNGPGRIACRVLQNLVSAGRITYQSIVAPLPHRRFETA